MEDLVVGLAVADVDGGDSISAGVGGVGVQYLDPDSDPG